MFGTSLTCTVLVQAGLTFFNVIHCVLWAITFQGLRTRLATGAERFITGLSIVSLAKFDHFEDVLTDISASTALFQQINQNVHPGVILKVMQHQVQLIHSCVVCGSRRKWKGSFIGVGLTWLGESFFISACDRQLF